jgi:hypothetical protein
MIPIIIPVISSSKKDHDGRRPSQLGIILSVFIFSIGIFLAFFLFLAEESSSPIPTITMLILFITLLMGIMGFIIVGTSVSPNEHKRKEYRKEHEPSWDYDRRNKSMDYCQECGSSVEFSDRFCTTCGSRLD